MKSSKEIKVTIEKTWKSYKFHKAWMDSCELFPYQFNITKPTNKMLLHHFDEVRQWVAELTYQFKHNSTQLLFKEHTYASMGRQSIPIAIEFKTVELLSRFLGKWQSWQEFCSRYKKILK